LKRFAKTRGELKSVGCRRGESIVVPRL